VSDLYAPKPEHKFTFGLWTVDAEIQALVAGLSKVPTDGWPQVGAYSRATAEALKGDTFDRVALGARGLGYERLDQLTLEVLLGVR